MDKAAGRFRRLVLSLPLVVVVAAPAVASWRHLMAVGSAWLGLSGVWAVLVPLALDAAALHFSWLAQRSALKGDSALVDRSLVWVYALGSAALNFTYGVQVGGLTGLAGALFFAAMSISAVVAWDRTLRALRRNALREVGAIEPPLPRFRALRWLVAPAETIRAWRRAVVEGITSPAEALELVRGERRARVPELGEGVASSYVELSVAAADEIEAQARVRRASPMEQERTAGFAEPADVDEAVSSVPDAALSDEASPVGGEVDNQGREEVDGEEVVAALAACEQKTEALKVAWLALGVTGVPETTDVMPAVEWLAKRGWTVERTHAYGVRRRLEQRSAAVSARSEQRLALVAAGGR